MKSLLLITLSVLSFSTYAASSTCEINLGVKKLDAKSAKLAGVSFSAKQIAALKSVCTVNLDKMSDEDLVADYKASLQRKHEREAKKSEETASN